MTQSISLCSDMESWILGEGNQEIDLGQVYIYCGMKIVKKSIIFPQMVLLITTAAIACIGSIVSTVKSQNAYREIQELTGGDRGDYDDDRCEDNSYNDINYCECEIKHGQMPNETRIARFQGTVYLPLRIGIFSYKQTYTQFIL